MSYFQSFLKLAGRPSIVRPAITACLLSASLSAFAGEVLYNGVVLPDVWPPANMRPDSLKPMPVPYLDHPPKVIPIDVGRQLFVDDFLIEKTDLRREYHIAEKFTGNPVLQPETPLELHNGKQPVACPFSDGVFYDAQAKRFKMWYHAGWFHGTAYAESADGITWQRPELDVFAGTNQIVANPDPKKQQRDGVSIWFDPQSVDPAQSYQMFMYTRPFGRGHLLSSADGIHWNRQAETGPCGDNTTFFYNPFRKKWVYSIRSHRRDEKTLGGRTRDYYETDDFFKASFADREPVYWCGADKHDLRDEKWNYPPQLYKLDAVGYESLMLGLFTMHQGPPNSVCEQGKFPKITQIMIGFSRDGFHWQRPTYEPFIAATKREGDWDRAYLHSVGGCCVIVGDQLYFYYGGFSGKSPKLGGDIYAGAATGIARLRRDGFASMNAGETSGTLTTRPVTFKGKHLFVNCASVDGELRAELLDEHDRPITPFTAENCKPVRMDSTCCQITWGDAGDLSELSGKTVKVRFQLTNGQLYAFWISPNAKGDSGGFLAAGAAETGT